MQQQRIRNESCTHVMMNKEHNTVTSYSGVPVFLHRHGLSSSRLCSGCGAEGAVEHFFSCRARRTANQHLLTELEDIVGERVDLVVSLLS